MTAAVASYCCADHGHVSTADVCANHGHSYDTLYPRSMYYCPQCHCEHGTSAVNGAVSWHCSACWVAGRKPVEQLYLGRMCTRCGALDQTGAKVCMLGCAR